jgi:hypothetical protein
MQVTESIEELYQAQGTRVVEHLEGHYEAQEVPFGVVYRWCPECVVIECDCGERLTLTSSMTTCGECGADHGAVAREEMAIGRRLEDKDAHPWRYDAMDREGIPC